MLGAILLTAACLTQVRDEAELKRLLVPYYAQEAGQCDFFLDAERQQPLERVEQPVLIWTNADNYMGAVFVWTFHGRPEMIGCIGSHQNRPNKSNVFQEFHSLSLQALPTVTLSGGKQWTPSKPGLTMAVADGAPRPAASERARLTQMRNLAREFDGWMKDGEDVAQLRLLPQPIFRYQSADRGVVDGAIFALVWKGTDPEILLVLEDRANNGDERWHYALARFNYREMWIKRHDKELWRVPVEGTSDVYITRLAGEISLDELQTATTEPEAVQETK
ncbi:MAG TPA: hypothetical protein VFI31_07240 [Pirellulales bacterium]|nr:hypothetical protein [Pirellulales bacterium]